MVQNNNNTQEVDAIRKRYADRKKSVDKNRYSLFNPAFLMESQERERKMVHCLSSLNSLDDKKIIEIGCGNGDKILQLIKLGFLPNNIIGNELLAPAIKKARTCLPDAVKLLEGDATQLEIEAKSFDIVYQSVVFSSILDDKFQEILAEKMWSWLKPGGSILWYDFIYNNPKNKDVRGVSVKRVKALFPDGIFNTQKLTLAPPISRKICKVHPSLYTICNTITLLRTHVLCLITKPNY